MKRHWHLMWPLVVGALALGATAWMWSHERQTQQQRLRDTFDAELHETATHVVLRMNSYEQMLRGTRGLFDASDTVTRADFSHYVDALLGGVDATGLRSIVYAPRVDAGRLEAHVALQREQGVADYAVRPAGQRPLYAPVTYVAPDIERTLDVRGYDVWSEPSRREAMERARDSGRVAITDRVHLASLPTEKPQPGFLMFMPLYDRSRAVDSVQARRDALVGWVFATFRIDDLMSSLWGEALLGLDVRVHDGTVADESTRIHPPPDRAAPLQPARFEALERVAYAGHTWTLAVRSLPEFETRYSNDSARIIAVAGTGLSLLLALLTWQLVTARERAHDAAREMTQQLRDGAERYRRIVETASEGIWTLDAAGRTSFVNPKLLRMLGYEEAELLGRSPSDFMHDDDVLALLPGPAGSGEAPAREMRFRRKDGTDLWAAVSVSRIAGPGGGPAGLLAMVTDITERKLGEANRALLEKQLRQSQKMEAIGTLAGGIAHDFNNILAAILGNVALARQEIDAGAPALQRLEQIGQAGVRARNLVQQIVAFSRQQPQALVVQPLRPLLEETFTLLRSTLPTLVELEARFSAAPLAVAADATQLQQVLMNLCTNAWHAMHGGSGRIVVGLDEARPDTQAAREIGGLPAGPCAHLWVQDDGCGMDEAVRQRLFEPFFTTKPVGQGTGLGLAVVHGIVSSHQGAIRVDSAPGLGSTFHLYFPLATPRAVPAEPAAPAPHAEPMGRGQHVLYVDDDAVMVVMVQALLQRSGWRVSCTDDPQHALRLIEADAAAYDVVVTDFNMPELSGLDLARAIGRLRPGLPVVITSGFVSDALRDEARRAGIVAVLQKEFTLEQLGATLHRVMAGAPAGAGG